MVSYIPLVYLIKNPSVGKLIIYSYMLIGLVSSALINYLYKIPLLIDFDQSDMIEYAFRSKLMIPMLMSTHNGLFAYFSGYLMAHYCLTSKPFEGVVIN